MIFLGDLACPPEKISEFNTAVDNLDIIDNQVVVLNLEALMLFGSPIRPDTLYNHEKVLDTLKKRAKKVIVSMANNHIYDYPEKILQTKEFLEKQGIGVFGLVGTDREISPYEFEDENEKYAFFGHCWNLYTATNPNRVNDEKIVDCKYADFMATVKAYIISNPQRKTYCFMHWNYDLELLPFPMHIKLSHDLIDAGVCGVIGSHSHVTQCVEEYKSRPIAYCLGNFYLPSGIYFNGKLNYPPKARHTIGLRVDNNHSEVLCFKTDCDKPISFEKTVQIGDYLQLPVSDIESYTTYFRKHRQKKLLVPVFDSYVGYKYKIKKSWAICRVKLIKSILKILR